MRRLHRLARVKEPDIGQYLQGTDVANIKQGLPLPISVPAQVSPMNQDSSTRQVRSKDCIGCARARISAQLRSEK